MDLLTAVNRILPVLGERPVTSLDTRNPTLAMLLPKIDTKIEDVSTQGYWFNTFKVTLYPDEAGEVAVPTDTLAFTPSKVEAIVRGKRLFNPDDMTYVFSGPVEGVLITRVPFNELPESVASLVWYSTLVDAYVTDIGMESSVNEWRGQAMNAEARMTSEHLRNRKYSTASSPRFQRIRQAMRA